MNQLIQEDMPTAKDYLFSLEIGYERTIVNNMDTYSLEGLSIHFFKFLFPSIADSTFVRAATPVGFFYEI